MMKKAIRPAIFKWRHTEPELICCAVRWYLWYSLSFRDVEELLQRREDAEHEAPGGGGGVDLRALPGGCFRHELLLSLPYLLLTKALRQDFHNRRSRQR